jgi:GNAT superfamily N-acetyltransferase
MIERPIEIIPVLTQRDRRAFVLFPWKVYKGDPNWVPPLISDRMDYLNPAKGVYYKQANIALFMAQRDGQVLGTIAAFVDHSRVAHLKLEEGGFGFFEVVKDYEVACKLLDTCCEWQRSQGMKSVRGPTNFNDNDAPGVLIDGADCPPAMLEAHTPVYYKDFLEQYGMEKDHDGYAWRAFFDQLGPELQNLPPEITRAAEVARRSGKVNIRSVNLNDWDRELDTVRYLFNTTLSHIPDAVPFDEAEFRSFADQMRPFLDPDLALIAEIENKPVAYCVLIPDVNRLLLRLNGRLFPINWLKVKRYIREIDVVSFKLMGVLEEYRMRGIDAYIYIEALRAAMKKGYKWLDGSLTSELNPMINLIARRLGAELYKQYRIYRKTL